jgi:hypothetical protein
VPATLPFPLVAPLPLAPRAALPIPATPVPTPALEPLEPDLPLIAAIPATPPPITELPAMGGVDTPPAVWAGVLPQPKLNPVSSTVHSAPRAVVFIVWLLLQVGHELRGDARASSWSDRGWPHHIKPFS